MAVGNISHDHDSRLLVAPSHIFHTDAASHLDERHVSHVDNFKNLNDIPV